jgi:hypothetical protein
MSKNSKNSNNAGTSAITILGLIFITLKLIGVIDWSWWWVLLPFYGFASILLAVLLFGLIIIGIKRSKTIFKSLTGKY